MRILITLALVLLPTLAMAQDITAVYQYHDGTKNRLYARGRQAYRMTTAQDSYMLIKNGTTYMCRKTDMGWRATDMSALARAYGGQGMSVGAQPTRSDVEVRYKNTGRTEMVAGFTGRVYDVSVYENDRLVRRDEVVTSTHSDVEALTEAWADMSRQMSRSMGNEPGLMEQVAQDPQAQRYGGILRYGDEMRLRLLEVKPLPVDFFDVPPLQQQGQPGTMPDSMPEEQPKSESERIQDTMNKVIDLFSN